MSTIVFVMMVYAHGGNWLPTLEFNTMEKCQVAAKVIKERIDKELVLGRIILPVCVRIEK